MTRPSALALALSLALLSASAPRPARAQSEPSAQLEDRFDASRAWSASLHAGLGTPYGGLGLEIERRLRRWLAVAGGAGIGVYGPQSAAALRLRAASDAWALGVSAGPGFGNSGNLTIISDQQRVFVNALWLNSELYTEYRGSGSKLLKIYVGVAHMLRGECTDAASQGGELCQRDATLTLPAIGAAYGLRF